MSGAKLANFYCKELTSCKRRTGSMQSNNCVICLTSGHSESQINPIQTVENNLDINSV